MTDKIAFIFSGKSTTATPGGLGAYAHNSCQLFHELGYEVHLFGYGAAANVEQLEHCTAHTVRSRAKFLSSLAAPLINQQLAGAARRVIQGREQTTLVLMGAGIWAEAGNIVSQSLAKFPGKRRTVGAYFTTFLHEYKGQVAGASARDYGIIANFLVRMSYLAAFLLSKYEHRTLKKLDDIIVHYSSSRSILTDECKSLAEDKISTTDYYTDLYVRQGDNEPTRSSDQLITLAIICRQDPRKGINTFLHAVSLLKNQGLRFKVTIAGNGIFLARNISLSKKLNVDDIVEFAGFIPSAEALIIDSDIMVLPSFEEGAGAISLLEAMKVGRPIISSNCDGIPEDLSHDHSALLFTPGDSQELAKQMRRLISDPSLRTRLAKNAKSRYDEKFSFQLMKDGFKKILDPTAL